MPEIGILLGAVVILVPALAIIIHKRPRNLVPELPESEIHKRNYIATGDIDELSKMDKALEREGG